jgi:TetR/AcrR family transcriptional regulator, regulator of cefoperazone and chloramphenicol sensitivity
MTESASKVAPQAAPNASGATDAPASSKPLRGDGAEARSRLLDAALMLFADRGFSATSIRDIAHAAQMNVASISYYFGDKAGLYRAVWTDPRCNPDCGVIDPADAEKMSLEQALRGLLGGMVEIHKQGELARRIMRLHYREMLEPTGVWQDEIDLNIKPAHMGLVRLLCHHLKVDEADDDIHSLAFSMAGLGMMLHVAGDVFAAIRPQLVASHQALDAYGERLVFHALALVEAERQRRANLP